MSQSAQGHSLIIQIKLDNSGDALRYEVDKVTLMEGKIPGNDDPASHIHFDCFHCKAKYFIWSEIVVKLERISKPSRSTNIEEKSELDLQKSGSSKMVLCVDDGTEDQSVGQERPETVVNENQHLDLQPFVRSYDAQMKKKDHNHRQHQKTKKNRFTCDICKASLKNRKSLIRHMNIHLGILFSCSECPKSFSRKDNLAMHEKLIHQSEFRVCEVCRRSKTCTKDEYYSHLRRRHPEFHNKEFQPKVENFNGVDFPCIYCEPQATFISFEELKEHFEDAHDRNFPCTRCPKAFNKNSNLNRHIESVHEKKMFNCPKCDKVFAWKRNLQKHLRSHDL